MKIQIFVRMSFTQSTTATTYKTVTIMIKLLKIDVYNVKTISLATSVTNASKRK